jgi:hypothetical protein
MAMERQHLLTARSLIYNQLVVKEEIRPSRDAYPDAHADLAVIQYVNQLDYGDCRRLYSRIAGMDPWTARRSAGGFPSTAAASVLEGMDPA